MSPAATETPTPKANLLICDGCGQPASPEHIADRIARLEWATRYRPIHIQALFVAEAPKGEGAADYVPLLNALGIPEASPKVSTAGAEASDHQVEEVESDPRMSELQRRGFYLAFLSECPLGSGGLSSDLRARLAKTLVKRIERSYRPKQVALLGVAMEPVIPVLKDANLSESLLLDSAGHPLELPGTVTSAATPSKSAWEYLRKIAV